MTDEDSSHLTSTPPATIPGPTPLSLMMRLTVNTIAAKWPTVENMTTFDLHQSVAAGIKDLDRDKVVVLVRCHSIGITSAWLFDL